MKIETDDLQIAEVHGRKYRLAPLVERGPRRRVKDIALCPGIPVSIALTGVVIDDRGTIALNATSSESRFQVQSGSHALMSIDQASVTRNDRRSGTDRRVL